MTKTRTVRAATTTMAATLALTGAMWATTAPTAEAATVCSNAVAGSGKATPLKNAAGTTVATIWFHERTTTPRGCYVLQADMYRGTPHYMYLRICDDVDTMSGCTGWDAGNYSFYAGPINTDPYCNDAVVRVHAPDGRVLFDHKVHGLNDYCD